VSKDFKVILLLIFLALAGFALFYWKETSSPSILQTNTYVIPTPGVDENYLWDVVQSWRKSEGKKPYIKHPEICQMAKERAEEIAVDFSHDKFSEKYDGTVPYILSENLANASTAEEMLDGWLNSASHAAALNKNYKYSCISCRYIRCVQLFSNLEGSGTR